MMEDERASGRATPWFAGLLLLGVSAVLGCRVADSDGVTPVTQMLAFLPWLLAPTGLALLLSLLARWRTGLVWGVVVLGGLAWFIEPYGKTDEPSGPPVAELRVMTSNVQVGQGTDALVAAVRRHKPDIVFVQECEQTCSAALRDAFEGEAYPYRQAVEGYGTDGSVILSRHPLTKAEGVPGTMGMPGATADVEGNRVRLQLAHPMPPLPGGLGTWRRELGRLRAYAAAGKDTPTILAGDFNASQDHAAFRRILDTGLRDGARLAGNARTPTWPARTTPAFGAQIDHVLVSRDFAARRARFLDLSGTDHRTLLVDLTLHQGS
ncbi:endonuclease/exonuclease/phosphatase family protein [Streptomyces phyllanthi]|uniref:Endonuclease/exonuclease/phosphatase family protein n=2 Tax=Streptomyces phyllanthi TaxID=1803180 RepID=A0A5N8W031_9ACTN|nr:endonuclease/exonuclease/phosphatase family protein [Streptomyces phyllanthi]MPY40861.1 endonuclease/exonuclease/phosphatase family protein [Streptomyces phyllanthi]